MNIGEKVALYRNQNNYTQQEFAHKLGISRSYLGDIENGKVVGNVELVKKLSKETFIPIENWVYDEKELDNIPFIKLVGLLDSLIASGLITKDEMSDGAKCSILEVVRNEVGKKLGDKNEKDI